MYSAQKTNNLAVNGFLLPMAVYRGTYHIVKALTAFSFFCVTFKTITKRYAAQTKKKSVCGAQLCLAHKKMNNLAVNGFFAAHADKAPFYKGL